MYWTDVILAYQVKFLAYRSDIEELYLPKIVVIKIGNIEFSGIGRRLLAEEVANVAIWMRDCARLQSGLVGPSNIRHFNCPPLDGHCFADHSKICDDRSD